jgi:hypothetical protein
MHIYIYIYLYIYISPTPPKDIYVYIYTYLYILNLILYILGKTWISQLDQILKIKIKIKLSYLARVVYIMAQSFTLKTI